MTKPAERLLKRCYRWGDVGGGEGPEPTACGIGMEGWGEEKGFSKNLKRDRGWGWREYDRHYAVGSRRGW